MFLGIRDIAHARGRFALIGTVVGLITLLLVMLTGLTGGLGAQNTSALSALGPDRYVFTSGEPSFTESSVSPADLAAWESVGGVTGVSPVGFTQTRMEAGAASAVAVIGLPAGHRIPGGGSVPAGGAVLSESLADAPLDPVTLGGVTVPVAGTAPDEFYAHSPVVWVDTRTWQVVSRAPDDVLGTVLAVDGGLDGAGWTTASADTGTVAATVSGSFAGLAAYQSEQGSLRTMQGFLYAISALVTVAFLTVWTIQRTRDLAILRALGASARYLVADALGQAALILAAGVFSGALVAWGLGAAAGQAVPFLLTAGTVLYPALGVWALGIIGALLATRRVANIDPLTALGGNG